MATVGFLTLISYQYHFHCTFQPHCSPYYFLNVSSYFLPNSFVLPRMFSTFQRGCFSFFRSQLRYRLYKGNYVDNCLKQHPSPQGLSLIFSYLFTSEEWLASCLLICLLVYYPFPLSKMWTFWRMHFVLFLVVSRA